MTHPCNQCDFQATSARHLSRHKAIRHTPNPLKCVLCPFITAYQTNLLRHRREVHGILGSKGNKSCKFCGFEAEDNDTLVMHQQEIHGDILRTARERFAREKKSARGNNNGSNSDNEFDASPNDTKPDLSMLNSSLLNLASITKDNGLLFPSASIFNQTGRLPESGNNSGEQSNDDEDKDFWKESFIDNPASIGQLYAQNLTSSLNSNFLANFQKNFNKVFKNSSLGASSKNGIDLSSLNGLASLSSRLNGSLNALNSMGNGFGSSSAFPDDCSPDSSAGSSVGSRPESRNSKISNNLEINLQDGDHLMPEVELHELNGNRSDANANDEDIQTEAAPTFSAAAAAAAAAASANALNPELAPTRIRRQYACSDCDFRTVNPREFLYHRRDVHNQKVKIVECPYCVYACQYFQKLQRHMLLVHKLETSITPPNENGQFVKQQTMINQSQVCTTKKDFFVKKSSSKSLLDCRLKDDASPEMDDEDDLDLDDEEDGPLMVCEKPKSASPRVLQPLAKGISLKSILMSGERQPIASTSNGIVRPVQMIKCKHCSFQADSFSKLELHESEVHAKKKKVHCPFCEIKFDEVVWLQRHLPRMHEGNAEAQLYIEMLERIMPSKRKRMKVGLTNNTSSSILDHEAPAAANAVEFNLSDLQKLDKNCTKCSICNYETKWFSELQKHMRVHINEKPFGCQMCSFKTKWKGDLNRHVQKYHAKAFSELSQSEQQQAINPDGGQFEEEEGESSPEQFHSALNELEDGEVNDYAYYDLDSGEGDYKSDEDEENESNVGDLDGQSAFHRTSQAENGLGLSADEVDLPSILNGTSSNQLDLKKLISMNATPMPEPQQQTTISSSVTLRNLNENMVKVYKCCYCDFICNTASRFHVHFVQHLNTKPFMCSVCEHRSNWAWDITKHIKMKSQKGDDHENAEPLLVHHSGKRDYRKYDKYLILINKNDIDGNSSNQQDTRGLIEPLNFGGLNSSANLNNQLSILSNSLSNSVNNLSGLNSPNEADDSPLGNSNLDNLNNLVNHLNDSDAKRPPTDGYKADCNGLDQDDAYNAESIVITPDLPSDCNEGLDLAGQGASNFESSLINSLNNLNGNLTLNSLLNSTANSTAASSPTSNKPSKLFYCAYCEYTHRDSKSLVSHLSIHAGKKPFKCRLCGFSSNWREVLNRHVQSRHNGTTSDIEQLFKYTVSKYICKIIDDKGQINPGPEITTQATIKQLTAANGTASAASPYSQSNSLNNSSKQSFMPNHYQDYQDLQDLQHQNSLLMLNSILARKLAGAGFDSFDSTFNTAVDLLDRPSFSGGHTNGPTATKAPSKEAKPKTNETPEVLAKHGIHGKVSGFKGEFQCDKCPFRAEKAFHMDFHSKRHVKMPNADFKCDYCDYWVNAKKSLVKHVYLHQFVNEPTDPPAAKEPQAEKDA